MMNMSATVRRCWFVGWVLCGLWLGQAIARAQDGAAPVTRLATEHCDFLILYHPEEAETNRLALVLRDEDRGINYKTNEVALAGVESSKIVLPAGTPFGEEGEPIWVLPQSQDPNLLYLGVSAERIPFGAFAGPFTIRLTRVEGPGHFFAWQASEFGGLLVKMNSRDGIDEGDKTTPIIGSHEHFNWGFTAAGVYRITFQAEGVEAASGLRLESEPSTFVWEIEPLPPPAQAPKLGRPAQRSDGRLEFVLFGVVGETYTVQGSTDLKAWRTLGAAAATGVETAVIVEKPEAADAFFLRVRSP